MARSKPTPLPPLEQIRLKLAEARTKFAQVEAVLTIIEAGDPDAALEAIAGLGFSHFSDVSALLWRIREQLEIERRRRRAQAPPLSPEAFEARIQEEQAASSISEAFCRHCGHGYMMIPGRGVAEDGSVIRDENDRSHCGDCGNNHFIYRANPNVQRHQTATHVVTKGDAGASWAEPIVAPEPERAPAHKPEPEPPPSKGHPLQRSFL